MPRSDLYMLDRLRSLLDIPFAMRVSLLTRISLIMLGFLTAVVAARLYGPVANGQIALIAAILALTSVISLGGCQMLVLKELPGKADNQNNLFTCCLVRVTIGAFLVGIALTYLVVPHFGDSYVSTLGPSLVWLLPVIAAGNAFRVFLLEALRAREAIVGYSILLVVGPLSLFMALPLWAHIAPGVSFSWLVVISELLGLMGALAMFITGTTDLRLVPIKVSSVIRMRVGPYYVSTLSVAAYQQDILVVGALLSTGELGVYVIASRLAGFVALPMITAGIGYAPQVARIFREEGGEAAIAHSRHQVRAFLPLTLPLAVAMVAGGAFILEFLGPPFREGYAVLVMLVAAHLLLALTGHSGVLLMMVGQAHLQQVIFVIAAGVMFALMFLLVPLIGMEGGGIAVLVGAMIRALLSAMAVQKCFGTGITAFHIYFGQGPATRPRDESLKS